jgi:hypothetical protein
MVTSQFPGLFRREADLLTHFWSYAEAFNITELVALRLSGLDRRVHVVWNRKVHLDQWHKSSKGPHCKTTLLAGRAAERQNHVIQRRGTEWRAIH